MQSTYTGNEFRPAHPGERVDERKNRSQGSHERDFDDGMVADPSALTDIPGPQDVQPGEDGPVYALYGQLGSEWPGVEVRHTPKMPRMTKMTNSQ